MHEPYPKPKTIAYWLSMYNSQWAIGLAFRKSDNGIDHMISRKWVSLIIRFFWETRIPHLIGSHQMLKEWLSAFGFPWQLYPHEESYYITFLIKSGPWFKINIPYQYTESHCGDKMVVIPSYLCNWFPIPVRCHLYNQLGPRCCNFSPADNPWLKSYL